MANGETGGSGRDGGLVRLHQLVDRNAVERPDATAVRDHDGRTLSWAALADAVGDAEAALRERGVRPGDRVLLVAENCVEMIAFLHACSRLDAWAAPINARVVEAELEGARADASARLAVFTTSVSSDAASHAARAGAKPVAGGFGAVALTDAADAAPEPVRDDRDQVAILLYTTGTTGRPKGVMLSHGNFLFAGDASAAMRAMHPGDVLYGVLPLTHVFGLASMLTAAATSGAQIWLQPRFRPELVLAALREGVTILPAVPQMHALIVAHAAGLGIDSLADLPLRFISSGGAPLDPELKRRVEALFSLPLQNGYGMTETTAGVTATRSALGSGDTSVGVPFPGVEVRLDTPDGGAESVGEILTRGPHVMLGYYRNPEETARVLGEDGFLRTGDLGRLDAEGRLHVVGRSKELIIRSGFNVYPVEVEGALAEHPKVVSSAVVGRPAAGGNEDVVAFVQISPGAALTAEELEAHLASRLSPYKRPNRYVITNELPATATGKILKHKLLDHFSRELG
jgi:acyl-CoA synthetase (AMP-forming)/AMP-acid ligase II